MSIAHVPPHGGLLREGRTTNWALIRPFPRVGVHVIFEVVLLAEHAATDTAGEAWEGWSREESWAHALQEKQHNPRSYG